MHTALILTHILYLELALGTAIEVQIEKLVPIFVGNVTVTRLWGLSAIYTILI